MPLKTCSENQRLQNFYSIIHPYSTCTVSHQDYLIIRYMYICIRHWRQCLMTCGAVSEGRCCRFLTIFCSQMYVSLCLCSSMLLIKFYVDYLFYYSKHFLVLLFLSFVFSLFLCRFAIFLYVRMSFYNGMFYMLVHVFIYMSVHRQRWRNKDDQSIIRYARFFNACFAYRFLICRSIISFTNFIKSLSLLVTFLNFRHGLSIDLSHMHFSIYKRSFYQEFQQISKWCCFENLLRKVGHIGLSHGCHVIWRRSLIGCLLLVNNIFH